MKTPTKLAEFFNNVAEFWNGFFDGLFLGDRPYNQIPPQSHHYPDYDYRNHVLWTYPGSRYDPINRIERALNDEKKSGVTAIMTPGLPKSGPEMRGRYGYPIARARHEPGTGDKSQAHVPAKGSSGKPVKTPNPEKEHRPDVESVIRLSLDVDFTAPVKTKELLAFSLRKKPFMDQKHDERLFTYAFFINRKLFRFCLGRAGEFFFFDNHPEPRPFFLLTSITERVEYFGNERTFVIFYGIRDSQGKKRKFRADKKEQEGVIEALRFFFTLRFYETWEEYDEFHSLCPALGIKAKDLRDQLRRDLCEAGMKLA